MPKDTTKDSNKPSKTWDFTHNNYTDADIAMYTNWSTEMSRMLVSKEVSPGGTPHLQARMTFRRAYRFTALKKLSPKCSWSITECPQDSLYCMKYLSDVIINVDNRKPGTRNDIAAFVNDVRNDMPVHELLTAHPAAYLRYPAAYSRIRSAVALPRTEPPQVIFIWGPPGTGKTRTAVEDGATMIEYHNGFITGYAGEDTILFDEFESTFPVPLLLKLTDRYNPPINIKGGSIPFSAKKLYFTMNWDPTQFINCNPALKRRITELRRVG